MITYGSKRALLEITGSFVFSLKGVKRMKINESFLIGVDISDGEDMSVVSVFKRNINEKGNVNLNCINAFYGKDADQVYANLVSGGTNNIR